MKFDKVKDCKCSCDNCMNTAIGVLEMEFSRVWLCKKCKEILANALK